MYLKRCQKVHHLLIQHNNPYNLVCHHFCLKQCFLWVRNKTWVHCSTKAVQYFWTKCFVHCLHDRIERHSFVRLKIEEEMNGERKSSRGSSQCRIFTQLMGNNIATVGTNFTNFPCYSRKIKNIKAFCQWSSHSMENIFSFLEEMMKSANIQWCVDTKHWRRSYFRHENNQSSSTW